MSERLIPILYLPGPPPLDVIIPADDLVHYYTAQQIVANAKDQAASILAELEEHIAAARDDVQNIREQARLAGMDQAKQQLDRLREQAIADAVEWLVAEDQLECHIANSLDEQLRSLLTQAMSAWLDERNVVDDLMRRVKQSLEAMAGQELASLYIPPGIDAALREELSAMPRVRIYTDATLTGGQARLESRLILIRLDLDSHRRLLLDRLSHP